MTRPSESEYASFYAGNVSLIPEPDVLGVLQAQPDELRRLAASVPSLVPSDGAFAPRQVVRHGRS